MYLLSVMVRVENKFWMFIWFLWFEYELLFLNKDNQKHFIFVKTSKYWPMLEALFYTFSAADDLSDTFL